MTQLPRRLLRRNFRIAEDGQRCLGDAATQWAVATRHSKGLAAMIPWEGFSNAYNECTRHGGIDSSGFLRFWWRYPIKGNQYGYPSLEENPGRPKTIEGVLNDEELANNRRVVYEAAVENE